MTVRRFGGGPGLVCLAGGPGRNAEYLEKLGGLADRFEFIIPDARGTGDSAAPDSDDGYGFDQLAADRESLRIALGFEQLTLLAHSAACTTALYYAAFHPTRLDALVLVAPGRRLYPEIENDTESILRLRHSEPQITAAIDDLDRLKADPSQDEVPVFLDALIPAFYGAWTERQRIHAAAEKDQVNHSARQLFGTPNVDVVAVRHQLSEVNAPVLVITGSKDGATGVLPGAAWAACFRSGEHLTIEGSGHYPWVDQSEQFSDAVISFLSSTRSTDPER